jgi:hypothetical protein
MESVADANATHRFTQFSRITYRRLRHFKSRVILTQLLYEWRKKHATATAALEVVADNYARLMDGAKADLVITDPPYNVAIDGHASGLGRVHHREFVMASGEMSARSSRSSCARQ